PASWAAATTSTARTPMATASPAPQHADPYKNFKFRVMWDGRYVAGVSKVGALRRSTEVIRHQEGGHPGTSRKAPGRTEYDAVTLQRGLPHDPDFEQWPNAAFQPNAAPDPAVDFRKDLVIEVYNDAGQLALRYFLYRCWVSEYQALPDLDAQGNAVAI